MSRYRRITPICVEEQERLIRQRGYGMERKEIRQFRRPSVPRPPLSHFLEKLAQNRGSGETRSMREIVTSTCFNLRGVCRNIRTFADDMESLLSSIETIAPVVEGVIAGYTRSLKSKESLDEKKQVPENMYRGNEESPPPPTTPVTETTPTQNTEPSAPPPFPGKVPTEQELKDFLNNPLVATLMQMVAKNLANPKK
ncbi:MAG: hypothetical protein ACOYJ1_07175 [Peptococcales bacterium]|jgi:hypothetical protein